jgi:aldehyde dehydrogenase family 7 member A1
MPDADLPMALSAVAFGAIGTAGQRSVFLSSSKQPAERIFRCTSTRRLYLQRSIATRFLESLQQFYSSPTLAPGDPLDSNTLLGPLHSKAGVTGFENAVKDLKEAGAEFLSGGEVFSSNDLRGELRGGNYVQPTLVVPRSSSISHYTSPSSSSLSKEEQIWTRETFAPILKVALFDDLDEAIALNNAVPQGLSASLWTRDMRNVGKWIGPGGSDCGIVNVSSFSLPFLDYWAEC